VSVTLLPGVHALVAQCSERVSWMHHATVAAGTRTRAMLDPVADRALDADTGEMHFDDASGVEASLASATADVATALSATRLVAVVAIEGRPVRVAVVDVARGSLVRSLDGGAVAELPAALGAPVPSVGVTLLGDDVLPPGGGAGGAGSTLRTLGWVGMG